MSKYYKAEDVIRKRAEDLADTSYWEYGNPKNVDDWIEVAEMEFKDLPTIEVDEDCISRADLMEELRKNAERVETEEFACDTVWRTISNAPSVVPSRAGRPDFADCEKCLKTYGTLGCCSTVNNKWVYSCLEGMQEYAYNRGYKDGAEQTRAEGEWYRQTTDQFDYWECSECGMGVGLDDIKNYCPNCGAKMRNK